MTGFASSLSATSAASALACAASVVARSSSKYLPCRTSCDAAVAERVQRVGDGPPLRIEHRWLQRHEDSRAHALPSWRAAITLSAREACNEPSGPAASGSSASRRRHEHAIEDVVDVPELLVEIERALDVGAAGSTRGDVGVGQQQRS